MFEDRAYWSESRINDLSERFRTARACGQNASAVDGPEASALLSSGVPLSADERTALQAQLSGLGPSR